MTKIPNIINSISIRYFRSINSIDIRNVQQINVFTGSNDAGKSNFIRALNLFFNEKDDNGNHINFVENFSHSRLEAVRKESIKGKQFIQIEIEFNCKNAFANTLPNRFKVKKAWYRDTKGAPDRVSNNLRHYIDKGILDTSINKAEGSLSKFLNSIKFSYVPAIKDKGFFKSIISELQDVLLKTSSGNDDRFMNEVRKFNGDLESQAIELSNEFKRLTGIQSSLSLPSSLDSLFKAFEIRTVGSFGDAVSLDSRGDGMRVRFLPAIMNYIAERSNKQHIWGFEEPENSMEYRRAFELSKSMSAVYSKNAQIFMTTHSPAFIDLHAGNQKTFLVRNDGTDSSLLDLASKSEILEGTDTSLLVADELGHIAMLDELRERMQQRLKLADEAMADRNRVLAQLDGIHKPVLLTEGPSDKIILEEAWKKLRGDEPSPFVVKCCDVNPVEGQNSAGADQLARCVRSILPDSQHIVIGIFDRDQDGLKAWNLDKNFVQHDLFSNWRRSKNNKSHGLLLPVPSYEPKFEHSETLCIELMFDANVIDTAVQENKLDIERMPVITRVGSYIESKIIGTEPWQVKITGRKMEFAQKFVPTLEKEKFAEFGKLFDEVMKIIGYCEDGVA